MTRVDQVIFIPLVLFVYKENVVYSRKVEFMHTQVILYFASSGDTLMKQAFMYL